MTSRLALVTRDPLPLAAQDPRIGGQCVYLHCLSEALRRQGSDLVFLGEDDDERANGSFDAVISHYWTAIPAAARLARRGGIPWIHTYHSLASVPAPRSPDPATSRRVAQEARAARQADAICAGSAYDAEEITRRFGSVTRLVVISPGFDGSLFRPRPDPDRGTRRGRVVLWVGRVARGKRLYLAVEAFAQMARTSDLDARLLVLGGPDGEGGEAELDLARRRAADLGVAGRVDFAGPVPHRQLPRWYAAADALLFTSERESFGLVVLEAQACGLPVVATAVGGVREIVADGISGRIVEEASAAALGTALRSLLREQPHRGVRAQALALRRRFSWAGTARCLLDLVASLEPIGDAASLAV